MVRPSGTNPPELRRRQSETEREMTPYAQAEVELRIKQQPHRARSKKRNLTAALENVFTSMLGADFKQLSCRPKPTSHDCVACQDTIVGIEIEAPCGHYYDRKCVLRLFQAATRDETLFPPRCCRQNISFETVRRHMSATKQALFLQKSKEFTTPNPVYCANPICHRFLGPASVPKYTCPIKACSTVTCAGCKDVIKGNVHHLCVPDEQDRVLLDLAQRSGWQRCPGCNVVIERSMGCNHITCRCGTTFCYLCQARWKTCSCPSSGCRLLAAPQWRVERDPGAWRRPPTPIPGADPPRIPLSLIHPMNTRVPTPPRVLTPTIEAQQGDADVTLAIARLSQQTKQRRANEQHRRASSTGQPLNATSIPVRDTYPYDRVTTQRHNVGSSSAHPVGQPHSRIRRHPHGPRLMPPMNTRIPTPPRVLTPTIEAQQRDADVTRAVARLAQQTKQRRANAQHRRASSTVQPLNTTSIPVRDTYPYDRVTTQRHNVRSSSAHPVGQPHSRNRRQPRGPRVKPRRHQTTHNR